MKSLNKYFICFCLFFFLTGLGIVYSQPKPDFSASSTSGCAPFNVQFTDLSSGKPTQWFWDFGNGTSSTLQNPVATYLTKGIYTVRLIAKNASGEDYVTKQNYITINGVPDVSFGFNKDSGCAPLNIDFINSTNTAGINIKSWLWNFGDGVTSAQQNPSHTYTARGTYDVTLTAQTVQGCSNSFKITGAISAGNAPVNLSFKGSPLNGCASAFRNFKSSSASTVNNWFWDFGDGFTDNTAKPAHHYKDTGWFNVKLIAADNGCSSTVQYNKYLHVTGPVSDFRRIYNCNQPFDVRFTDHSIGAKSWSWDFGDGNTTTARNPTHTYSSNGIYTVALTVSGGACTDSSNYTIYIINQKPSYAIIPSQKVYCKNDTITFSATNYDSVFVRTFSWSFDGGLTQTPFYSRASSIKNIYPKTGNYPSPILYILNNQFCYDTIIQKPISIAGATAQFTNTSPACVESNITFSDKSTLYKNAPIKQWKWNFGNGDSVITASSTANDKFSFPGIYTVLLKITDADGCMDTISHQVTILNKPVINAGTDTTICSGKPVTLTPTGGVSYVWNNSQYLSCINCANPIASPPDTNIFYVTGKNVAGCSARDSVKINVQKQKILTVNPSSDTICIGNSVQLTASGFDTYSWQPSTGLNKTNIPNPLATPLSNTVYTVTGTDKSGCFPGSASVNIVVHQQPQVKITGGPVTLVPGTPYQINAIYSNDIVKWDWQPAQWLNDASVANPITQPQQTTTYKVYAATADGCVSIDSITVFVLCNNTSVFIPNTFSPNGDGVNDYFYPRSAYAVNIKTLKIFNRWGQEIFENSNFSSNDQTSGWNGKFKNELQQSDVYMYIMQLVCSNGTVFNEKGSITLIK